MKNKYVLVSLICALTHLIGRAQCPATWNFVSPTNDFNSVLGYYESSLSITASNKVIGTSRITYDADVLVKLKPDVDPANPSAGGFKAKTSTFFKAIIDGCGGITKTKEIPKSSINLRIAPNPTSGILTFEVPSMANTSMRYRITDLTGRLIVEKYITMNSSRQTIETTTLHTGLYFLQVISEEKVIAVEPFVKQ